MAGDPTKSSIALAEKTAEGTRLKEQVEAAGTEAFEVVGSIVELCTKVAAFRASIDEDNQAAFDLKFAQLISNPNPDVSKEEKPGAKEVFAQLKRRADPADSKEPGDIWDEFFNGVN